MKRLVAVAFGISLLGGTLSAAQAQGTTGSSGAKTHSAGHRLSPQNHNRAVHKKNHRGGKKGKKNSGGTTQPPK
jgi:Ni/Co efflux regulator RcnB